MAKIKMSPVSHLVRFEGQVAADVDRWCNSIGYMSRTAAINHMCKTFTDNVEIESLRAEIVRLRVKVVNLAMIQRPKDKACSLCIKCNTTDCPDSLMADFIFYEYCPDLVIVGE